MQTDFTEVGFGPRFGFLNELAVQYGRRNRSIPEDLTREHLFKNTIGARCRNVGVASTTFPRGDPARFGKTHALPTSVFNEVLFPNEHGSRCNFRAKKA